MTKIMPLNLAEAKDCLSFCNSLSNDPKFNFLQESEIFKKHPEIYEKFQKDLEAFIGFLNLSVNSEFELIDVPERYYTVFVAVANVAVVSHLVAVVSHLFDL